MERCGTFVRSVLLPVWENSVRHRPIAKRLSELQRTQWRPLEELEAMQSKSLERLVRHAFNNVPFYRDRYLPTGLIPADIRTASDLLELPIIRRHDLQRGVGRESTIPPFATIREQRSSDAWRPAVKLRADEWAGHRRGDRAFHVPCVLTSEERLREAVRRIERSRPRVLVCFAQAGAELARYINRHNLRTWETLAVICGRVSPHDRAELEDAFGPAVFDTYGCRDVMHIAAECEAHQGLHVSMENVLVEIIVTENGRERRAREGESGEVVVTDLHNLSMPFIRYANGDIATAGPSRRCSCGRTLPRIQSIKGGLTRHGVRNSTAAAR